MQLFIILAGFGGGVLRGLVGFLKHKYSYKEVKFSWPSFLSTVGISGTVGVISALAVQELHLGFLGTMTPALALVIGYAGGDFLQGVYKIIMKRNDR
jgi:hypothetical protein